MIVVLRRFAIAVVAFSMVVVTVPERTLAAEPITETFFFTGAEQAFVVPDGVTSVDVILIGGKGGGEGGGATVGGFGARVQGHLQVEPGATLFVEVGGNGSNGAFPAGTGGLGGFNGGGTGGTGLDLGSGSARGAGGGGGASDIRTVSRADGSSLNSRLIVAAGGSGGGTGANGASAGADGTDVIVSGSTVTTGGGAGTASVGGTAGTGEVPGMAGSLGIGGSGGDARGPGGGGGGGFNGGGSGGGSSVAAWGASGGGGSSDTGLATAAFVSTDDSGVPAIVIRYTPNEPGGGTVDADVTMAGSAACLELSATAISFGTLGFGEANALAAPSITLTNCATAAGTLMASATDAAGPSASWSLIDSAETCADTLGTDNFRLILESQDLPASISLATSSKEVQTLPVGGSTEHTAHIYTPCPGSSGDGETLTFQINYLATE